MLIQSTEEEMEIQGDTVTGLKSLINEQEIEVQTCIFLITERKLMCLNPVVFRWT